MSENLAEQVIRPRTATVSACLSPRRRPSHKRGPGNDRRRLPCAYSAPTTYQRERCKVRRSDIGRRLSKLEAAGRPDLEEAREREEERERIREQAEHANRCGWGEKTDRWPLFEIDEDGDVFCTHDGKPVTDSRQILAEEFYWMEVEWGGPGLIHDEEAQEFRTPGGELALSRERVSFPHLMGPGRMED
jgi:hypothetical protein